MSGKKNQVIIVAVLTALALLGDSMLYIALPIYWKGWGVESLWMVGILLSINRLIRIPVNPLVGWLYTRVSLRTGLMFALVLGSFTTIGYSFANSIFIWILLRIIWGIAWSLLRIGGLYIVHQSSDQNNGGEMIGTYNGIYRLGSLGGMLIGGVLVAVVGFRETSLLFGILSLGGIFLLFKIESNTHREKVVKRRDKQPNRIGFGLVLISGLIVSTVYQGLVTSTLSHIVKQYGLEIDLFGIILAASAWAGFISGVRWVWEPFLAVRIGMYTDGPSGNRIAFYCKALVMAAVFLAVLPIKLSFLLFVLISLLCLAGATALTTLTDSVASDEVRRLGGGVTMLANYTLFQDIGASLGPLMGYLLPRFGVSLTGIYIWSAIVLLILSRAWNRRHMENLKGQSMGTAVG